MINAGRIEAAAATPLPSGRVVQLCGIQTVIVVVEAGGDQHLAVRQQRCCVTLPRSVGCAGVAP